MSLKVRLPGRRAREPGKTLPEFFGAHEVRKQYRGQQHHKFPQVGAGNDRKVEGKGEAKNDHERCLLFRVRAKDETRAGADYSQEGHWHPIDVLSEHEAEAVHQRQKEIVEELGDPEVLADLGHQQSCEFGPKVREARENGPNGRDQGPEARLERGEKRRQQRESGSAQCRPERRKNGLEELEHSRTKGAEDQGNEEPHRRKDESDERSKDRLHYANPQRTEDYAKPHEEERQLPWSEENDELEEALRLFLK